MLVWIEQAMPVTATHMPEPIYGRVLTPEAAPAQSAPPSTPAPVARSTAHSPLFKIPAPTPMPALAPAEPEALLPAPAIEIPIEPPPSTVPDAAPTPSSDRWPANTRLTYKLTGNYRGEVHGAAEVQWQREGDRYEAQLNIRLALVLNVKLVSQGTLAPDGLRPEVYQESFLTRNTRVTIDAQHVRLNDGRLLAKPEGVQDTASQFVELSHRFSTGRDPLVVGGVVPLWLARPRGLDLWTYDVVALDTLETPELGMVQAFHLKPRPIANPRGSTVADLWFAPSLQYLPVRVMVTLGDGNFVDLMVERIEQSEANGAGSKVGAVIAR